MTLRAKILVIVGTAVLVLSAGAWFALRAIALGSFERIERDQVRSDVRRLAEAVEDAIDTIDSKAGDWATWDETYAFIEDRNVDFVTANLLTNSLVELQISLMAFLDSRGAVVATMAADLDSGRGIPVPEGYGRILGAGSPLTGHASAESRKRGIVLLEGAIAMCASRPIVTSEGHGPVRGAVVFCRELDDAERERISRVTGLAVRLERMDRGLDPEFERARSLIGPAEPAAVVALGSDRIAGYIVLDDVTGKPAVMARVDGPRKILAQGRTTLGWLVLAMAAVGLTIMLLVYLLLEKVVVARLAALRGDVEQLGTGRDPSARVGEHGSDEIGAFARSVNATLAELERMYRRLEDMGYRDAMTGLHNRAFFEKTLDSLVEGPVGLIVCDIDGLKIVNDGLGHQAGDGLVQSAADVLRECFPGDVICRIGGDEFAVLLPGRGAEDVRRAAEGLRWLVSERNAGDATLHLGLSVGAAAVEGGPVDRAAFYTTADDLMYREKLVRAGSARKAIVDVLVRVLEESDPDTWGHSARVERHVEAMARAMGLPEPAIVDLSLLSRFHDVGKVGVRDALLGKPGSLTRTESDEMRDHCEIGARIVGSIPELAHLANHILGHHERWDGKGYPRGIRGEQISLESRMVAIAEAFDAMTSDAPYRKAMSVETALAEIVRCAGTQFDPRLASVFVSGIGRKG